MKPPMSRNEIRASLPSKMRKRLVGRHAAAITAASIVSHDIQAYEGDKRPDKPDVFGMLRLKLRVYCLSKCVKEDELATLVEIITGA